MILKVAIIGLGTVGSSVAQILLENANTAFQLTKVFTRNPKSSKSAAICQQIPERIASSVDEILRSSEIDIVIETVGGVVFAKELIEKALQHQKHVVSANKDLIATHGLALSKIAKEHSVHLLFGAAVCGGIPILKLLGDYFQTKEIEKCFAVLNGTNNYILTEIAKSGKSFEDVLVDAQKSGYAEAIPDNDIKGFDARYKIAILANFITNQYLDVNQILLEGIEQICSCDFDYALFLQKNIKHIAYLSRSQQVSGKWEVGVFSALVALQNPIAQLQGAENGVQLWGEHVKGLYLQGQGAGSEPTASAIIADLWNIHSGITFFPFANSQPLPVLNLSEVKFQHTLRFWIYEDKGIVARITQILTEFGIGIHSILQLPQHHYFGQSHKQSIFVIVLEKCLESQVQDAIAIIDTESFMKKPTFVLREVVDENPSHK